MPTTRSKKTVETKAAGKTLRAKSAAGTAAKAKTKAAPARAARAASSPARTTAKAAPAKKAGAAKASRATRAKAPAAAKAPAKASAKSPAKASAPRKKVERRIVVPDFEPRPVPIHELDGKPSDPRLAAALAARERWHGRSGRPALKSATQAVAFVRERLLVHPRVRSVLPNLIDPIVGRTCTDEEREQGVIAQTLQAWKRDIYGAPDLLEARLCFERPTLVAADLWPALVTVAAPREEAARAGGVLTPEAAEALDILDRKGVMPVERLRQMVGLDPDAFARVHAELEARLLVLSRGDVDEDDNPITVVEPLGRWAERALQRKVDLEVGRAWTFLFIAALRSAVVLWPEEIEAIFPWTHEEREAAIAEAMTTGTLITYNEGDSTAWVASPVPR